MIRASGTQYNSRVNPQKEKLSFYPRIKREYELSKGPEALRLQDAVFRVMLLGFERSQANVIVDAALRGME